MSIQLLLFGYTILESTNSYTEFKLYLLKFTLVNMS